MQFLSANWLRSASRTMRGRNPRLYSTLNGVRNRLLSGGTGLAAYQAKALRRFRATCLRRTEGARVLEIGSDVEGRVLRHMASWGITEAVGVNPASEIWSNQSSDILQVADRAVLRRADARHLPFEDGTFDSIFSVATFEHILELPLALAEMRRVLRPGGALYANFGPIWSAGRGHHLRVQIGSREFRHFLPDTNPLADFSHLLLTPEQLRSSLSRVLEPIYVEPIVEWVYDDPGINRLFHHEYVEIFKTSGLELSSLRPERDHLDSQLKAVLELRYPREQSFEVTNTEAILVRRS